MPLPTQLLRRSGLIFSPKVAVLSAGVALAVILGCMSLNTLPDEVNATIQTGSLSIPANSQVEVYFKVPYHQPPDLTITGSHNDCVITEQNENFFRIRNKNAKLGRTIEWKASGHAGLLDPTKVLVPMEKRAVTPQEGQASPPPASLSAPKNTRVELGGG